MIPNTQYADMAEAKVGRAAREEVPVSPFDVRFEAIDGQLEHVLQLVMRLPHFAGRLENIAERLQGPIPATGGESEPDRSVPPAGTVHAKLERVSLVLDVIASETERGLTQLASAVDRVDDCV